MGRRKCKWCRIRVKKHGGDNRRQPGHMSKQQIVVADHRDLGQQARGEDLMKSGHGSGQ
jgi:hypothetical protein